MPNRTTTDNRPAATRRAWATALATALAAACTLLAACAATPGDRCADGQVAMVSELLYFGSDKPGGPVSAADWQTFLDQRVTPRFPQGLSVWRASGQWQSAAGAVVREGSWVLNIVHPGDVGSERQLDQIVQHYKTLHQQEAVLRSRTRACVTF